MKNKNLLPVVFFVILIFSACDFITEVYKPQPPPPPPTDSTRYILLEDYTGHACPNCPEAAVVAKDIKDIYKERVIVMALHVTKGFAAPQPKHGLNSEFRTPAGDAYDDATKGFGTSSANGLPAGMVNRKNFINGLTAHILGRGKWMEAVVKEVNDNPNAIVKLKIENEYDAANKKLKCSIKSTFFYDTIKSNAYSLVVCVIQDEIVAPQQVGKIFDLNYVHNHVLRDNLNGTWGEELVAKGKIEKGVELTTKCRSYTFPDAYPENAAAVNQTKCEVKNCHIVAYIYNNDTKEVVQVAEAKVIK